MTTSGTSDFIVTRNEILYRAARLVSVIAEGETLSAAKVTNMAMALNSMVKNWQATGIHVWTVTEGTLFPQADTASYAISNASTSAHATQSYVRATLTADTIVGGAVLTVDDATDFVVGQHVGVIQDDGTMFWSTVSALAATSIMLADGLDDSSAAGNFAFGYTSKIVRPLRIVDARILSLIGGNEIPLGRSSRLDYNALPNKTNNGGITQFFYDPQLTTGRLYLWQTPSVITDIVNFTWYRPIQDFVSSGDNPDLPQEWIEPLVYNLAWRLAPEYTVPANRLATIKELAIMTLDTAQGSDRESEDVCFGVDMDS